MSQCSWDFSGKFNDDTSCLTEDSFMERTEPAGRVFMEGFLKRMKSWEGYKWGLGTLDYRIGSVMVFEWGTCGVDMVRSLILES